MKTDLTYLQTMSGGDKILIHEMIDIFIDQIKEIEEGMKVNLEERNYDFLGKLAHKAKSSVAIMGMNSLAKKLKELELLTVKSHKSDKYPDYIKLFSTETKEAIIELREYQQKQTRTRQFHNF